MAKKETPPPAEPATVPMLVEQVRVLSERLSNATRTYSMLRKITDSDEDAESVESLQWKLSLGGAEIADTTDGGDQLVVDFVVQLTNRFAEQLMVAARQLHAVTSQLTDTLSEVNDDYATEP